MGRKPSKPPTKKESPLIEEPKKVFKCCMTGKPYTVQKGNFFASYSPLYAGNNGYLPISRPALDKLYYHYCDVLNDEEEAIRRVCMKFDIYYNPTLAAASKKISADRSRIGAYISRANLTQYNGKSYDSTIDEEAREVILSFDDVEDAEVPITKKMVKMWGFGFSSEDYQYLESNFDDWKAKVVVEGKAKESLVRELCVLKLQQNKALLENKIDMYNKLTDTFQKTLDRAQLTPKIESANDKAGEKPIGVMIDMFENERPIPEPLDEWKDVDGIIKLFSIYFLGHLSKMLNIKNKYSKMYEDEMNKYRVEVPELNDADDDDVFDFLASGGAKDDEGSNSSSEV